MMCSTSGCLFWSMATESVQLAQCAALQPLVALVRPNPQARTAQTPPPALRDTTTCWSRDWPQTGGPSLGERTSTKSWPVVLRKTQAPTMRFGGLPLPGFARKGVRVRSSSWHEIRMANGNTQNFEFLSMGGQSLVHSPPDCVGVRHPRWCCEFFHSCRCSAAPIPHLRSPVVNLVPPQLHTLSRNANNLSPSLDLA